MRRFFVDKLYAYYYRDGLVTRLWHRVNGSKFFTRLLFGVKIVEDRSYFTDFGSYFDLTTVLLRNVVKKYLRLNPNAHLLEIGVGAFVILSRSLARYANNLMIGVDRTEELVEKARKSVDQDKARIEIFRSDVLGGMENYKFDIIFWNLPYYVDPETYLPKLFEQIPNCSKNNHSVTLLGFNASPSALPLSKVDDIIKRYPDIDLCKVYNWWWARHNVVMIRPNSLKE